MGRETCLEKIRTSKIGLRKKYFCTCKFSRVDYTKEGGRVTSLPNRVPKGSRTPTGLTNYPGR